MAFRAGGRLRVGPPAGVVRGRCGTPERGSSMWGPLFFLSLTSYWEGPGSALRIPRDNTPKLCVPGSCAGPDPVPSVQAQTEGATGPGGWEDPGPEPVCHQWASVGACLGGSGTPSEGLAIATANCVRWGVAFSAGRPESNGAWALTLPCLWGTGWLPISCSSVHPTACLDSGHRS